jgi:hypothetical protein
VGCGAEVGEGVGVGVGVGDGVGGGLGEGVGLALGGGSSSGSGELGAGGTVIVTRNWASLFETVIVCAPSSAAGAVTVNQLAVVLSLFIYPDFGLQCFKFR